MTAKANIYQREGLLNLGTRLQRVMKMGQKRRVKHCKRVGEVSLQVNFTSQQLQQQTILRKFYPAWQKILPWLQYDKHKDLMSCSIYVKHMTKNTCTMGTNNFGYSTLKGHVAHYDQ